MKYIGALVGTMSGSMGGATASRNRGGQYLRQRVVPTNPATARQVMVRNYLSGAVTAWASEDDAVRAAWKTYADNVPTTDSLGQTVVLTGQQMYIRCWVAGMMVNQAFEPFDAPTTFNRGGNVVSFEPGGTGAAGSFEITGGNVDMDFTLSPDGSGLSRLAMYIGRPVGPAVNFYSGPYQIATYETVVGTSGAFDQAVADLTIAEPIVAGQRRPIRLVNVDADGRVSTDLRVILTVEDTTP